MSENVQLALVGVFGTFLAGVISLMGYYLNKLSGSQNVNNQQTAEIHAKVGAVPVEPTLVDQFTNLLSKMSPADMAVMKAALDKAQPK